MTAMGIDALAPLAAGAATAQDADPLKAAGSELFKLDIVSRMDGDRAIYFPFRLEDGDARSAIEGHEDRRVLKAWNPTVVQQGDAAMMLADRRLTIASASGTRELSCRSVTMEPALLLANFGGPAD